MVHKQILGAAVSLVAAACGNAAPPPPPSPALTRHCPALPDRPAKDGDWRVRAPHDAVVRQLYADCADRHRGLVVWSTAVTR